MTNYISANSSCGTVALMVLGQFSDICGPIYKLCWLINVQVLHYILLLYLKWPWRMRALFTIKIM